MTEEEKEHWSEWFDWATVDIYETIYHEVPGHNWCEVNIEFEHKDGSISKAYMCPYEDWTDDPYCNYYVRGWKDGSYNIGDWIMSHHS